MIKHHPEHTLVLTSYPPRVCGIATYAQDLLDALERTYGGNAFRVCALERGPELRTYPSRVDHTLNTIDEMAHIALAARINADPCIKRVWVQHEFGLYPGGEGRYLLELLRSVRRPVAITFHTVLPQPTPERKRLVQAMAERADDVIVLTQRSADLLEQEYGVARDKVAVIPHGTHVVACGDRQSAKKTLGLEDRMTMSTFGLLSPNKSIETAIEAMPAIVKKVPHALYFILGRTHPEVVVHQGERYRKGLMQRVEDLGLSGHVRFVDRYLELGELLEYLCATDVYLFTSKDPEQAVSGTFAYAMGCGCPVISTRIPHAQEMLADAGTLIDFNSPKQLSKAALWLLRNDPKRKAMGRNALQRTRATSWDNMAIAHMRAFTRHTEPAREPALRWPDIDLSHVRRCTTEIGMVQFCDINEPDLNSGYTLDDNARALVALVMVAALQQGEVPGLQLMKTYLNFIERCQQADGSFINYIDRHGRPTAQNKTVNLDDANGRAIWALGTVVQADGVLPPRLVLQAGMLLDRTLSHVDTMHSPRALSFAIKGLYACASKRQRSRITAIIDRAGNKLLSGAAAHFTATWKWIEPGITYGNAVIPEALLLCHLATGHAVYREVARTTFDFLLDHTFQGEEFRSISNISWLTAGEPRHAYGEQPIEAAYTILALEQFHQEFGGDYRERMEPAFAWFLGRNHLHQTIYDRATGGCKDGLEQYNVSLNQGAESTVCYLMARATMERDRALGVRRPLPERQRGRSITSLQLRPAPARHTAA
jgi:glycosyltransferase involved in cell wall biosynthesis